MGASPRGSTTLAVPASSRGTPSATTVASTTLTRLAMTTLRRRAERFHLDRQLDQETKLVLACEANGMVPQLERVADEYGVRVISSGGFDSTTAKYHLAEAIAEEGRPVEVLHIGDYDC